MRAPPNERLSWGVSQPNALGDPHLATFRMPRSGFQRKAGAVGSIPTHHYGRQSLRRVRFPGGFGPTFLGVGR